MDAPKGNQSGSELLQLNAYDVQILDFDADLCGRKSPRFDLHQAQLVYLSKAWSDFANPIGMPDLGFHNLRHTHASQLIDAGVDIVTISKRGHQRYTRLSHPVLASADQFGSKVAAQPKQKVRAR
jgi:integrase